MEPILLLATDPRGHDGGLLSCRLGRQHIAGYRPAPARSVPEGTLNPELEHAAAASGSLTPPPPKEKKINFYLDDFKFRHIYLSIASV